MILNSIIILALIFVAVVVFLVISPISITASFKSNTPEATDVAILFLHPSFLRFAYCIKTKKCEVTFLRKVRFGLKEQQDAEKEVDLSGPVPGEKPVPERTDFGEKTPQDEEAVSLPSPEFDTVTETRNFTDSEPGSTHIPEETACSEQSETGAGKIPADTLQEDVTGKQPDNTVQPEDSLFKKWRIQWQKFRTILGFIAKQKTISRRTFAWLCRVLRKLFGVISYQQLSMHIRVGCADPAVFGVLHGTHTALMYGLDLAANQRFQFDFEPVYEDADSLSVEGACSIKTSIAQLIQPGVVALLTFPYISAFLLWRRYKKLKVALKQ